MEGFEGFEVDDFDTADDVRIRFRHGGSGPGLLLLHGNPLTHVSWHKVAAPLAQHFHVVAADLRGYGDSSAPEPGPDHVNYSFRAMAQDQIRLMAHLGHQEFYVAGHDRGARVVHRMCLDHPELVRKAALLDILPSQYVFTHTSKAWAMKSWHWSFMAQPADLPEGMMGAVPAEWYMERKLSKPGVGLAPFHPDAFAEYVRCFTPKTIRGSCEDYRATATYDFELDTADLDRKVSVPTLVLWGLRSHTGTVYGDVLGIWKERIEDVRGRGVDCGHYVNEEAPDDLLAELLPFFRS
ncbi:MAG: alpha/beta fold hydrolase [Propionibacteriales bacterium]|nr:alpha/beta fold hydrolase [Propionibacteriales bacterium]